MSFDDLIKFDEFVTRDLMAMIYLLGALVISVTGIAVLIIAVMNMFSENVTKQEISGVTLLFGVAVILIGNLAWRICCEALVVIFKINDSLISIDKKLTKQG